MAVIKKDGNIMALPLSISRGNPIALDATQVWYEKSSMEAYAKTNPTAYPGQYLTLVDEGNKTVEAYVIANEEGTLVKLASTTASGDVSADIVALQGRCTALEVSVKDIQDAIAGITSFEFVVVDDLPELGEKGKIYLVSDTHGTGDVYDEFIWVEEDGIGKFEKLGNTDIDLSNYYTKSETDNEIDTKVKTVSDQLAGKQDVNANLTALSALSGAGLVTRTSTGTFAVDTNTYLTAAALEGYAQTTVTDALSERITANEEVIAAINDAESGILVQAKAYTDANKYDDTTLASKISANTTSIGENTSAIASIKTELSTVKTSVSANTSAIEAINDANTGILKTAQDYADNKVAANKTLIDSLTSRVAANETAIGTKAEQSALQAEIDRATAAEEANKKAIDLILDNPDTETIDSIKELTKYVEEDGKTTASLVNRLAGIGGEGEPATVIDAINAASVKIATDTVVGGLKTSESFKVDATAGTVTAVSTDIIVQGQNEFILFGGDATN